MTQSYQDKATNHKRVKLEGYADAYRYYRDAGWTPLPLPHAEKFPPPAGFTGQDRRQPGERDYHQWAAEFPDGNVALVMPEGVIGLDIDAYHGGRKTKKSLYSKYGPIPVTWESTSRDDGSGIGLYKVPPGTRLVSKISGGIEIIQFHHRYACVWPSIHPEGRLYDWWRVDDPADIPEVYDLPELPDRWVKGLTARASKSEGKRYTEGRTYTGGTPYTGDTGDWLADHDGRVPLRVRQQVRAVLRRAERSFSQPGGRYDAMVSSSGRLVHLGAEGAPVAAAIDDLSELYCDAVDGDRIGEEEFWRSVSGAISKFGNKSRSKS